MGRRRIELLADPDVGGSVVGGSAAGGSTLTFRSIVLRCKPDVGGESSGGVPVGRSRRRRPRGPRQRRELLRPGASLLRRCAQGPYPSSVQGPPPTARRAVNRPGICGGSFAWKRSGAMAEHTPVAEALPAGVEGAGGADGPRDGRGERGAAGWSTEVGPAAGDRHGDAADLGAPGGGRRRRAAGRDARPSASGSPSSSGRVRELRRANEILKAASVFFARELDPRPPR